MRAGASPALTMVRSIDVFAFAFPVFFAQVSFEDLAGATFGEGFSHKFDAARDFVPGDLCVRVGD